MQDTLRAHGGKIINLLPVVIDFFFSFIKAKYFEATSFTEQLARPTLW